MTTNNHLKSLELYRQHLPLILKENGRKEIKEVLIKNEKIINELHPLVEDLDKQYKTINVEVQNFWKKINAIQYNKQKILNHGWQITWLIIPQDHTILYKQQSLIDLNKNLTELETKIYELNSTNSLLRHILTISTLHKNTIKDWVFWIYKNLLPYILTTPIKKHVFANLGKNWYDGITISDLVDCCRLDRKEIDRMLRLLKEDWLVQQEWKLRRMNDEWLLFFENRIHNYL